LAADSLQAFIFFLTVRPFILLRKIRNGLQAIKHFFVVAEQALHQ
jgi:hypothetical protein